MPDPLPNPNSNLPVQLSDPPTNPTTAGPKSQQQQQPDLFIGSLIEQAVCKFVGSKKASDSLLEIEFFNYNVNLRLKILVEHYVEEIGTKSGEKEITRPITQRDVWKSTADISRGLLHEERIRHFLTCDYTGPGIVTKDTTKEMSCGFTTVEDTSFWIQRLIDSTSAQLISLSEGRIYVQDRKRESYLASSTHGVAGSQDSFQNVRLLELPNREMGECEKKQARYFKEELERSLRMLKTYVRVN